MKAAVTGAAGFLGARLAAALVAPNCALHVTDLLLVDLTEPSVPADNTSVTVRTLALDLTEPTAAERVVEPDTAVLFHLAALVSGSAEENFDLGMLVNLDSTRALLQAARWRNPRLVFILTSSIAVYGGVSIAPCPRSSYGCAKAMAELLASEYGRRGWADTRVLRLPTVAVRGGRANTAVSSFASDIVRETLAGRPAIIPVPPGQRMWLAGPESVVRNLLHAATLPADSWRKRRVLSLPGLTVDAREMVAALTRVCGPAPADLVRWEPRRELTDVIESWPSRLDVRHAKSLGFFEDSSYDELIRQYICDELGGRVPE